MSTTLNATSGGQRRWRMVLALGALLCAYPFALLVYVYGHTLTSGLPGNRHGPMDAYRHALASAFLAYTTSPRIVDIATAIMEYSSHPSSAMDRHNNAIGARIGADARSFSELQPRVLEQVRQGTVMAGDPQQVTWMPARTWGRLPF